MESPPHQLVVAAVVRRGERLLLCQRPLGKRHGGLWELPGGKVHPGESDAEAIRRELSEELGLTTTAVGAALAERADPGSDFVIRFVVAAVTGEPTLHEHLAAEWVTPAEAADLALAPTDRWFVAELQAATAPPVPESL